MDMVQIIGSGATAKVLINGNELHDVTKLALNMSPVEIPILTLEIAAADCDVALDDVWVKRLPPPDRRGRRLLEFVRGLFK